jgi:hypothetical protein
MQDATPTKTKQYQCRHIFTDGRRCASPCLRQEEFCYYHHTTRRPVADPRQRRSRRSTFDLPHPEDRSSIQSSIGEVLRRIASNAIDTKRAGLLLYGLQIASINLPRVTPSGPAPKRRLYSYSDYLEADKEDTSETTLVKEFVVDPRFGILAPRTEIVEEEMKLTVVGKLLKDLAEDRVRETAERAAKVESEASATPPTPEPPTEAAILPSLQATAASPMTRAILPTLQASDAARREHRTLHAPTAPPLSNSYASASASPDIYERPQKYLGIQRRNLQQHDVQSHAHRCNEANPASSESQPRQRRQRY